MPYTTRVCTFGPAHDFYDNVLTDGTLTFWPTVNLVYDGTPLLRTPLRVPLNGSGIATATLINTDQAGFTDGSGNPITDWRWKVRVKVKDGPAYTKHFLVPTAGGSLDIDLVPDVGDSQGTVVVQGAVTSVNGQTGAVIVGDGGVSVPSGGTTGQSLVKDSNADGDVGWGTPTAINGKSAYELAQDAGFSGSQAAWLASLVGATGATGATGAAGQDSTVAGPEGPAMEVRLASGGVFPARGDSAPKVWAIADTAVAPASPMTGDLLVVFDSSSSL